MRGAFAARRLHLEDVALDRVPAGAAPFRGPVAAEPALLVQDAVPLLDVLLGQPLAGGDLVGQPLGQLVLQELAHLVAKRLLLVREAQVHLGSPQKISNRPAAPWPPPMHMVTTPSLGAAAVALEQQVPGHPRAGHAERVADRDRPAVDVEDVVVDAELVAAIERLAGEGLVQLPEVDVVDLQPLALEQARNGKDRARCPSRRARSPRPQSPGTARAASAPRAPRRPRAPAPAPPRRPRAARRCPR